MVGIHTVAEKTTQGEFFQRKKKRKGDQEENLKGVEKKIGN